VDREHAPVIPAVIPQATTAPNQTGLTRIAAQPELPRPNWAGLSGRLAVITGAIKWGDDISASVLVSA
jgi:hypothetical protein